VEEGELPQLTHNLRPSCTSRSSRHHLSRTIVSRCWKSGRYLGPTYPARYTRDARFECLEKRFAFESTIDLRCFDSPRGNNLGRHIGSDATTIFDSFVPAMNFQVVASWMLPRSIARAPGLVIACRCDMSRRFFLREFHSDVTPLRIGSKYTGTVCERCDNLFNDFVVYIDTARKIRKCLM